MDNVTGHRWCPCPRRCDKTKRNETKGKERRTKGFKTGKLNRLGHLWCTRIIGHAYPWARVSFPFVSFPTNSFPFVRRNPRRDYHHTLYNVALTLGISLIAHGDSRSRSRGTVLRRSWRTCSGHLSQLARRGKRRLASTPTLWQRRQV